MKDQSKNKRNAKKLTLKKETLRDLSDQDLMNHEGASTGHQGQLNTWGVVLRPIAQPNVRLR